MNLSNVKLVIAEAQQRLADLLSRSLGADGSLNRDQYTRYLSMQYHLTNDVQRYFITASAHRDLARRRGLRKFLFNFANEEEQHYLIAANDLRAMGASLHPLPFDVLLWHAYFQGIIVANPFLRLGAACILENLSSGPARPLVKQALRGPFLNKENTRFLVLHQHEANPHGDQFLEALEQADLEPRHWEALEQGARRGAVLYLRAAEWALDDHALSHLADPIGDTLDPGERLLIENFRLVEPEPDEGTHDPGPSGGGGR